jgi:hypothetical protein
VSNSSGRQIEDREHTSSAPASGSRLRARGGPGLAILGLGLTGLLLTVALVTTFYPGGGQKPNATRPIPPTSTTQPTGAPSNNTTNTTQPTSPSQPNNPPRAFVGREERDLGRGFAVDPSSEPYPNSHLETISLTVSSLPLVPQRPGPPAIRIGEGKVKESGPAITHTHHRRTSSSLDLLSRADLAKDLILFSRMLNKLD